MSTEFYLCFAFCLCAPHKQTQDASHLSFALLAISRHRQSYMQACILSLSSSVSAYARKKGTPDAPPQIRSFLVVVLAAVVSVAAGTVLAAVVRAVLRIVLAVLVLLLLILLAVLVKIILRHLPYLLIGFVLQK